jgi:hypothetical protein
LPGRWIVKIMIQGSKKLKEAIRNRRETRGKELFFNKRGTLE